MRNVSGIEIQQAIVHIIDPKRPDAPILSHRTLPIASSTTLTTYFADHIATALRDPTAKAARFVDLAGGSTSQICRDLFTGTIDLVKASQGLAMHLHGIMAGDQRISSGDLAMCLYRAASHPDVPFYLALVKIDASQVLRPRPVDDGHGNVFVALEVLDDVMPTARERLQKCAFIRPLDPRPEYDMVLLDRQRGTHQTDQVARFFIEDFMGATMALDARQRTDRLYRGLVSAQNRLRHELSPMQDETLHRAIEQAIASERVDVDAMIQALPVADTQKAAIKETVAAVLPDLEVEIDPGYRDRLLRRRIFRGDHELRLTVRADEYDQVVRSVERISDGDRPPRWRVVLETEKWEEVVR